MPGTPLHDTSPLNIILPLHVDRTHVARLQTLPKNTHTHNNKWGR